MYLANNVSCTNEKHRIKLYTGWFDENHKLIFAYFGYSLVSTPKTSTSKFLTNMRN